MRGTGAESPPPSTSRASTAAPSLSAPASAPVEDHGTAGHDAAETPTAPGDVRLLLEKQFAHHALLMMEVMRAKIDEEPQVVEAGERTIRRNTNDLAATMGSLYGGTARDEFLRVWSEQVKALTAYGTARAQGDPEGMAAARAELKKLSARYGETMSRLTNRKLSAAAARRPLDMNTASIISAADAYASRDFAEARAAEQAAYGAMFRFGTDLSAQTTATSGEAPAADDPAVQLRSGMGRLLGEHSDLAADLMRSIVSHAPSAEAAAAALNRNSRQILTAVQGTLDADAAKKFGDDWGAHTDALVAFAVAIAEGDTHAQSRTQAALDRSSADAGAILSALSGGKTSAATVSRALRSHNDEMLRQATAYAARDFVTSQHVGYDVYNHMFSFADTMAAVLEAYAAKRAPRGGAATGGWSGPR